MATLSDEVLGAYIDDALSPDERAAVERLLHEDPMLEARVAALRAADAALRAAASTVAPPAEHDPIAARIRTAPPTPAPRWRAPTYAPLLSAALVAGVLGLAAGRLAPSGETFAADPVLSRVLDSSPSGQSRDGVNVILTFETAQATPCRQFSSAAPGRSGEGVACRANGKWRIMAWIAGVAATPDGYHAAGANEALDSVVDKMDASGALPADQEAGYIRSHWRRR